MATFPTRSGSEARTDQRLRIVGSSGAALLIERTPWTGNVNGACVTANRFTISLLTPERIVHYVNRDLTLADLLGLLDFVQAALVADGVHLIPAVESQTAGFEICVRAIEDDELDLIVQVVVYLDEEASDVDGIGFLVSRVALWEAKATLERWLEVDVVVPDDIAGLGGR